MKVATRNLKPGVFVLLACLCASTTAAPAASERELASIKTREGIRVIANQPGGYFMLDIKGRNVQAAEKDDYLVFIVDGRVLRFATQPLSAFMPPSDRRWPAKQVLRRYMDHEMGLIEKTLNVDLDPRSRFFASGKRRSSLFWVYDIPKKLIGGDPAAAREQMYAVTVVHDIVVVLNGVVTAQQRPDAVRQMLMSTAATIDESPMPIDVETQRQLLQQRDGA